MRIKQLQLQARHGCRPQVARRRDREREQPHLDKAQVGAALPTHKIKHATYFDACPRDRNFYPLKRALRGTHIYYTAVPSG